MAITSTDTFLEAKAARTAVEVRLMSGDVRGIPDLASPAEVVQTLGVKFEIEG
jgi:hypothetical protein